MITQTKISEKKNIACVHFRNVTTTTDTLRMVESLTCIYICMRMYMDDAYTITQVKSMYFAYMRPRELKLQIRHHHTQANAIQ